MDFTLLISILYYTNKYGDKVIFWGMLRRLSMQYFLRIQENCKKLSKFIVLTPCDNIIDIKLKVCSWLLLKLRYNKCIQFLFKNRIVTN